MNASIELVVRKKLYELSKYGLSLVHGIPPGGISSLSGGPKNQENISNRRNSFRPVSFPLSYGYRVREKVSPDTTDLGFRI
jgi:hypothetical protein